MSDVMTIVVIAVVAAVLALIAFLVIRRQRYIRALRGRGWTFESSPQLESVLNHHAPPFGLGFVRKVDEAVSGTTSTGVPFRVFEYASAEGGPDFDERLASLQLPLALPEVFVTSGSPRSGVNWPVVEIEAPFQVRAADPAYAKTVLSSSVLAAIDAFGQAGRRVDLSIDGARLVAVGAPKDPDQLQAYLEALAPVAQAVDAAALASYVITPPPPGFSFYGRPDWLLIGRDDTLIARYGLTTAGFGHETEKVVRGDNDGLPLEAFIHRWKTQRTETDTDSEGRTRTRTVTENHSEILMAVNLPFSLPTLSFEGGWGGQKVRFESEEFNGRFTVRTSEPKFAYDVIHPRTMEWLMADPPPGFKIEGQVMRFSVSKHDTEIIGSCADFAHAFFARVPSFVWKDRQITPPRFREALVA